MSSGSVVRSTAEGVYVGPVVEGGTLRLACHAEGGDPRPQVTWWDGHRPLDTLPEDTLERGYLDAPGDDATEPASVLQTQSFYTKTIFNNERKRRAASSIPRKSMATENNITVANNSSDDKLSISPLDNRQSNMYKAPYESNIFTRNKLHHRHPSKNYILNTTQCHIIFNISQNNTGSKNEYKRNIIRVRHLKRYNALKAKTWYTNCMINTKILYSSIQKSKSVLDLFRDKANKITSSNRVTNGRKETNKLIRRSIKTKQYVSTSIPEKINDVKNPNTDVGIQDLFYPRYKILSEETNFVRQPKNSLKERFHTVLAQQPWNKLNTLLSRTASRTSAKKFSKMEGFVIVGKHRLPCCSPASRLALRGDITIPARTRHRRKSRDNSQGAEHLYSPISSNRILTSVSREEGRVTNSLVVEALGREDLFRAFTCEVSNSNLTASVTKSVRLDMICE